VRVDSKSYFFAHLRYGCSSGTPEVCSPCARFMQRCTSGHHTGRSLFFSPLSYWHLLFYLPEQNVALSEACPSSLRFSLLVKSHFVVSCFISRVRLSCRDKPLLINSSGIFSHFRPFVNGEKLLKNCQSCPKLRSPPEFLHVQRVFHTLSQIASREEETNLNGWRRGRSPAKTPVVEQRLFFQRLHAIWEFLSAS